MEINEKIIEEFIENHYGIVMRKKDKTPFEVYSNEIFPDGASIMCSIHDSFDKENDLTHNCIGCNFAD